MWIRLLQPLKSEELVHGMSRLKISMTVFCKWQICRASLRNILLDDLFKHVVDKVEGLYTHWFLGELWNSVKTYIEDTYEG